MKIFTAENVKEIDQYTIENEPINSIDLMERAAKAFVTWFMRKYDYARPVRVFCGPGNNGGDGFAIARMLRDKNYHVKAYLMKFSNSLSEDCHTNVKRLRAIDENLFTELHEEDPFPEIGENSVVVDAIFGSGLSRPAEGFPSKVIQKMNDSVAEIVSVDIPSGLFGEDNRENDKHSIIRASYTISFQFPFLSFFFADNYEYTGRWRVVPIGLHPEIIREKESSHHTIDLELVVTLLKKREKYSHKGTYGHALIIAGSHGMMGAAVMTARGCLRAGSGLVTAHVPRKGVEIMQSAFPEALINIDQSETLFTGLSSHKAFTAVGAGPGLGKDPKTKAGLEKLLEEVNVPIVLDADALNIISENPELMDKIPENTIITPHPGEFDRLTGKSSSAYERHMKQRDLAEKHKLVVVLKGANTIVALPDGTSWINTTGNTGLSSGGSGDVLTGMITSFLAQDYSPPEAAACGAFIHGLAADLALKSQSEESMIAGDVIENLGEAFKTIKKYGKIS